MQPDLEQRLRFCPALPTLPGVALRIVDMAGDPDTGLADVAKVISRDPALSIKLLKVANSPMYGLRRRSDNLHQALALLGLNTAVTLALSFSLRQSLGDTQTHGLDTEAYWRRSLLVAETARAIARLRGLSGGDEFFLAGLLSDIGMLALDALFPGEYGTLVAETPSPALPRAERECFGTDHAEVGAWLLAHWHLPDYLSRAVAGCEPSPDDSSVLVPAIDLARRLARVWFHPEDATLSAQALEVARRRLDMDEEACRNVLESVATVLPEVSCLFDIQVTDPAQIGAILDQAREMLVIRNLRLMQEATEFRQKAEVLEARTHDLEERSRRDALTGVFNRGYLDRILPETHDNALGGGLPLTVAFLDLDHFKRVNDNFGHQFGDRVLIEVAALLTRQLRQTDIVARYGGEEFVLVLPGVGREVADKLLSRVRDALRNQHFVNENGVGARITVSVGLVTLDKRQGFADVQALVQAADRALYAAKRRGRDRIMVLEPETGLREVQ